MSAFCIHCGERVRKGDETHRSLMPFQSFCPKCRSPAEYTGEIFIVFGLLIALLYNMILDDESPIFGDIVGGALVGLGVVRLFRHLKIKWTKRRVA